MCFIFIPVCKALVEEERYLCMEGESRLQILGRNLSQVLIFRIDPNQFPQNGFGFMGGFAPLASARFGNFTLSADFGGLLPSLFNLQVHGFPDAAMFGPAAGFPYGFQHSYHGGHAHGYHHHHHRTAQGQQDQYLKMLFLFIIICVIFAMIYQ
ncbi:TOM1-like protein 2-like [Hibiscus syriacus]|uniref:TOM1-like protein 2-like n=1 Tax=Hibiscus syriacus TaxID=106335 RepID=A0A6A3CVA9_HIBSY|nr:TOM1-like protein 2-like [Hibiscus syriacus]